MLGVQKNICHLWYATIENDAKFNPLLFSNHSLLRNQTWPK
jgi:hypothetical protein